MKSEFMKLLGEKAYSAYNRVKNNQHEKNDISPYEAQQILMLSEKWLKELKE